MRAEPQQPLQLKLRQINIGMRLAVSQAAAGGPAPAQRGTLRATFDIYNAGRTRFAQEKLKIVGHVPGLIGMLCLDSRMMKRQGLPAATHEHNK
jgi:hypothetical protein